MAGGGPPETFKIVRYVAGPQDLNGNLTFTPTIMHVVVSLADRIKIAEILGITDLGEQKRLLSGSVSINAPSPPAAGTGRRIVDEKGKE